MPAHTVVVQKQIEEETELHRMLVRISLRQIQLCISCHAVAGNRIIARISCT
jgi:hypothetical protein